MIRKVDHVYGRLAAANATVGVVLCPDNENWVTKGGVKVQRNVVEIQG